MCMQYVKTKAKVAGILCNFLIALINGHYLEKFRNNLATPDVVLK